MELGVQKNGVTMQKFVQFRRLELDTKLTLIDMMSQKGTISRSLNRPCWSIWGMKFLCLPSLPIDSVLAEYLVYMDLEQETHFIQVDAKKIADKDNTIKNLIMELAESKEKVQGRNVVIL